MNPVDRVVEYLAPRWALQRKAARAALAAQGYRSARPSRLDRSKGVVGTPDYHLEQTYDRRDMVDKSRKLQRDNAFADGLLARATENIVGCGIRPQARTKSDSWNRQAEKLFDDWAEREADVRGMATFWELQRLICRDYLGDGDVGVVKRDDGALQVIPSPLITSPYGKERDIRMRDGVELDINGRPIRYHVNPNPAPWASNPRGRTDQIITVEADDFLFAARRMHADQTRGLPVFAQTFTLFDQIDGLIDAVIVASRMAACFGLVVKSPFGNDFGNLSTETVGNTTYSVEGVEPGMIRYLDPGEEIQQIAPEHPGSDLPAFLTYMVRVLGLQLGMPLELTLMDFSQTNLSSIRAGLQQAHRSFRCIQSYFISHILRPIYEWKIQRWIAERRLPARPDALTHEWLPEGWPMLEPIKELQGHLLALDMGVTDIATVVRSQGRDFEALLQARKDQMEKITEAGLPVVHSSLTREGNGSNQNDAPDAGDPGSAPDPASDGKDPEAAPDGGDSDDAGSARDDD